MTAREPAAADVLAELHVVHAEIRASLAESRLDWADRWSRSNSRLDEISRQLSMLIDLVAAFRAEYNNHHHGEEGAA